MVLRLENIIHYWDKQTGSAVVSGFQLSLGSGEKLALEGRSGSGKTTLLRISAGLLAPRQGTVTWRKQNSAQAEDDVPLNVYEVSEGRRSAWRQQHIGYLDQDSGMLSTLTLTDNARVPLPKAARKDPTLTENLAGLFDKLGIGHLATAYPNQCSGGERQRAGIARALLKKPSLLILDEPTASLDHTSAIRVLELLDEQVKQGSAVLVSSHDDLVKEWVDRAVPLTSVLAEDEVI